MERRRGHYLGTEIDEKWWRRYTKDGLLARGMGEFWMDASSFFFRRHLTNAPIVIAFCDVLDVKVGKWHSGKWAGGQRVVKILWKKTEDRLSSGFVLSRDAAVTETLVQEIQHHMQQASNNARMAAPAADNAKRRIRTKETPIDVFGEASSLLTGQPDAAIDDVSESILEELALAW